MNANCLKQIENYAEEQMAKLGLHGWPHVKRVLALCRAISEHEGPKVNAEVLEIAALLHDVAKHTEKENASRDHGFIGSNMAEDFLNSLGYGGDKLESVGHAIRVHTHGEEPRSLEARILHDADFLDKMGAVGVATVFIKACLIDMTIEETATLWKEQTKQSQVAKHILWLKKPHFYTGTARSIAERRNRIVTRFFRQLEKEIELEDF